MRTVKKLQCPIYYLLILLIGMVKCQIINQPPHFIPGSGDMSRFSLSENTPVGSPVYQLKGIDPELSKITYSISGPVFSVDRATGVVRLRQELDRETQNLIEVIISITDESIMNTEPNTISLRREIPVRDYNDNAPVFIGRPYTAVVSESTEIGGVIDVKPNIIAIDRDEGINSEINFTCVQDSSENDVCSTFELSANRLSNGNYSASLKLLKTLDYESRPSYILTIMAKDNARENQLSSFATISIEILDVQDQPPVFLSPPYSATIEENTPEDTSILTISAIDGDVGNPRSIYLTIEDDIFDHFKLETIGPPESGKARLLTTSNPLDRENPEILQNGGVYVFNVRATELIDNQLPADSTITQVTIVVTDIDDNIPTFNLDFFNISIPENLKYDMPLPGLSIFVDDKDMGANSIYQLSLRNIKNSDNVFSVSPISSKGRTPVVVKILDASKLDYDVDDPSLRNFEFEIVASVKGIEESVTRVQVNLLDANDNSPIFEKQSYRFKIEENLETDTKISDIIATDRDSGIYGEIIYILKGFGSENFYTNRKTGGLFVRQGIDYEKQNSYSLTIAAIDQGGREANANIFIEVIDINDNAPIFEEFEYTRTIREGGIDFEPQFFVRALDADGPTQGGGLISYNIDTENSVSGNVFGINATSGEIKLIRAARSMDTEKGEYELIVTATDHGHPPLSNTTRVLVRVGISGNQRPVFKGHFRNFFENVPVMGPPSYQVSIPENAEAGYNVTMVTAHDPDGIDSLLRYRIVGANDNFVINEENGLIQVSSQAHLDRDANMDIFEIVVNAVDAGLPISETATTTVYVNIKDINDEPPQFEQANYVAYVSERTEIGIEVLKVTATDKDLSAKLNYNIKYPVKALTKAGISLPIKSKYDPNLAFRIDHTTGEIYVNHSLHYDEAAVITMTIEVKDLNAEVDPERQFALTDVTIYIQSFKDTNPIFKNKGWSSSRPLVNIAIKEEMPIDSTLFTLIAEDPTTKEPINSFETIEMDNSGYFELHDRTGEIILRKRLDYETLDTNNFEFQVKAKTLDGQRSTITKVNITVENVNDNSPIFEQKEYKLRFVENKSYPEKLITVHAIDKDAVLTERDEQLGYHKISYSLIGNNAHFFVINNSTGQIIVAPNQTIDRERTQTIRAMVKAEDSLGMPSESKFATVELFIDVIDVNDNAPEFSEKNYTAVIPESASVDALVLKVTANDPDEGPNGEVRYELWNDDGVKGLFMINFTNGEIRTRRPLTGKGRSEPYELIIRAHDNGAQIPKQESLSTDVTVIIYIGDVSANDGVPFFISPKLGQTANISEDATISSPVFHVIASDPDSPDTPSGTLFYKILENTMDSEAFRIDAVTGIITTTSELDREIKDTYIIIIEVSDNGEPRQSVTRVLKIIILDADDHEPRFIRDISSTPVTLSVLEESPSGTIVGSLTAVDEDIGANGAINYIFIDGNQDNMFDIKRVNNCMQIVTTRKRIDREQIESFLLTIKCFKYGEKSMISRSLYNRYDFSEIQVLIKIIDIDDNTPEFLQKNPSIGIRINVPVDTFISTVHATDKDAEALPIHYAIENITFIPQFYKRHRNISTNSFKTLFTLNNQTGELRTAGTFTNYVDGYFRLIISANNSEKFNRRAANHLKIFVIRDKSLLKFIFAKPPNEVQLVIREFQDKMQEKLKSKDMELHVLDTQVSTKSDCSLDFTSTSSCFQIFKKGSAVPLHEMQKLMDSDQLKSELFDLYVAYGVSKVELCSIKKSLIAANLMMSAGTWLVIIATLIGIFAIAATCTACCLKKKYKRHSKKLQSPRTPPEPYSIGSVPTVFYTEPIYGPL